MSRVLVVRYQAMAHPLPPKKEVVLALLERATVFVHLDPRKDGVVVPRNFKTQPQLVLQIGLNMAVTIPDLRVDDEGITCTLSFDQRGFYCSMPWTAIYAMVGEDGRGMVWPDDLPPEVAKQARQAAEAQPAPAESDDAASQTGVAKKPKRGKKVAAAGEEKPKRGKGKKEPTHAPADIRKRLVAVPAKSEPDDETNAPDTPAPPAQRKPKRELPPYLRVVK